MRTITAPSAEPSGLVDVGEFDRAPVLRCGVERVRNVRKAFQRVYFLVSRGLQDDVDDSRCG
jgi:arginine/ornithine N-succinyltransferase beta subunit